MVKWIVELAQKRPWWALVACLLIAVSTTWGAFWWNNKERISDLKEENKSLKAQLVVKDHRIDEYAAALHYKDSLFSAKDELKNRQITDFMAGVLEKEQERNLRLEQLERRRMGLYRKNEQIIEKNQSIISNTDDAQK